MAATASFSIGGWAVNLEARQGYVSLPQFEHLPEIIRG